jgi:RHS repeat-associated protein
MEYAMDDAGRNTKVSAAGTNYWDTAGIAQPFTADGRVIQAKLGNTLWETYGYAAGMPVIYSLGTTQNSGNRMQLIYGFHATQNNGNVMSQSMSVNNGAVRTQSYGYDEVNRLAGVVETGGSIFTQQGYEYDRWGNRWLSFSLGGFAGDPNEPTSQGQFNPANNQLTNAAYDDAGNQLTYNGYTYEYDADGRNTAVKLVGSTVTVNVYDGMGRRVKKVESGVTTYYVYDAFGRLAAEYLPDSTPAAGTSYAFTDMLGSVRAVTSSTGVLQECYDYLPFGRMLSASDNGRSSAGCFPGAPLVSVNSRVSQKFTGQPHDNGTGLDYFGARFYSASMGRFISPDPVLLTSSRMRQPHTLNLYAYANNNPLRYIDPSGMNAEPSPPTPFEERAGWCNPFADASGSCRGGYSTSMLLGNLDMMALVTIHGWTPAEAFEFAYRMPSVGSGNQYNRVLFDYDQSMAAVARDNYWGYVSGLAQAAVDKQQRVEQRIQDAIPGAEITGGTRVQGGHLQVNIRVTRDQLDAAGFTPYEIFGKANGYRNGFLFMQVHVNGRDKSRLDASASGVLRVQAHIDIFNPASGLIGLIGHGIVELVGGSLFFSKSTALDPR